eukprot:scaffold59695_cov25-Phaeocystis_antarctica.AAC.1
MPSSAACNSREQLQLRLQLGLQLGLQLVPLAPAHVGLHPVVLLIGVRVRVRLSVRVGPPSSRPPN